MKMGRIRQLSKKLDLYRKVPVDLYEGTQQGSFVSWLAVLIMSYLFYRETVEFFSTKLSTELTLDQRQAENDFIKVTFNISMMDLSCKFVEVNVISVLGNNQNVTKSLKKLPLSSSGIIQALEARNIHQTDVEDVVLHDAAVTKSIEDLHEESGEAVIKLDAKTFQYALSSSNIVFVDFFASWCSHCSILAPTWEVLAKVMVDAGEESEEEGGDEYGEQELREAEALDVPVVIAKVDCVEQVSLCRDQNIRAYPSLRLFVDGEPFGDYGGRRTVLDMVQYLKMVEEKLGKEGKITSDRLHSVLERHLDLDVPLEEKHWIEAFERTRKHHENAWKPNDEHSGCQIAGSILLNRCPGKLYIQAFSQGHDLEPTMTNCSHEIHFLSFAPLNRNDRNKRGPQPLPSNFHQYTTPMNGNVYITHRLHEAFHHFVKLVPTNGISYQVLTNSQLASYQEDDIPEAKFIIDLSPIAVKYEVNSRRWYDYATSLMAIIGGSFTVVGVLEPFFVWFKKHLTLV